MDRKTSELVARVSFKALAELAWLVAIVKDNAQDDAEYQRYQKVFRAILDSGHGEILRPIFDEYPEKEKDIEEYVADFGRLP